MVWFFVFYVLFAVKIKKSSVESVVKLIICARVVRMPVGLSCPGLLYPQELQDGAHLGIIGDD